MGLPVLILCILLVCGCATPEPQFARIVVPAPVAATSLLAPGDSIRLTFTPEYSYIPATSRSGKVDAEGNITGMFGRFHVAGLTSEEATTRIQDEVSMKSRMWGHGSVTVGASH
jgi:protein involved in polysaccharide export with SLBB domain